MISTITRKRKILFFIPFGIVSVCLVYSWIFFILTEYTAVLPHYLAVISFIPILYFLFFDRNFKRGIVLFGVYLILGTINFLSFVPFISTSSIGIFISDFYICSSKLNGYGLLMLILYSILNFDTLVDIHLDHKEAKGKL